MKDRIRDLRVLTPGTATALVLAGLAIVAAIAIPVSFRGFGYAVDCGQIFCDIGLGNAIATAVSLIAGFYLGRVEKDEDRRIQAMRDAAQRLEQRKRDILRRLEDIERRKER